MSTRDAARARWRADFQDYVAAALDKGGLASSAAEATAAAGRKREYADLMEELANAKAGYAEDANVGTKAILDDVKSRVVAHRLAERTTGPPAVGVINNFEEPSDAELESMGY